MKTMKILCLTGMAAGLAVASARADITLTDLNSTVNFSQDGAGTVTGMRDWIVDGTDQLFTQWFWFRVAGDDNEHSLNTLSQSITLQTSRLLGMNHVGAGFTIDTLYVLTGGTAGSTFSDIAETIRIVNTGQRPLEMSFFQYSDFDLNGGPIDAGVQQINPNLWRQTDAAGEIALSEASAIPTPVHGEAAVFADTINKLNDGNVDDLNDVLALSGPGDYTWAWQWNLTLNPGGAFIISKDKQIQPVPVPGAVALAMLGMGMVGWAKRRVKA